MDMGFYEYQLDPENKRVSDFAVHYCRIGWKLGLDPNRDFSTRGYLKDYPDVAAANINPFVHYVTLGRAEGRVAQPSTHRDPLADEIAQLRAHVDTSYYLQTYPDIAEAQLDPVEHFCAVGWREGRNPHPAFSTCYYLDSNADVAAAGINPYLHYVTVGQSEARAPLPPMPDETGGHDHPGMRGDLEALRPHFDPVYYSARWADVREMGIDPLLHFCTSGWKENRDPNAAFSTSHYLAINPDVAAAEINPFLHYILVGRHEGRSAQHLGGYKAETLRTLQPLEYTVRSWKKKTIPDNLLRMAELSKMLVRAVISGRKRLIVSVGHDHYRKISGGVQLCIQREEDLAAELGAIYLNIHPWQPLPRLAHVDEDPDPILCLILDGADVGLCRMSTLIDVIAKGDTLIEQSEVVIHHLLGHLPERIADLIKATGRDECWLWLHDFFTLCPSYALQRNAVSFCGAPPSGSDACRLCLYGAEREEHLVRIAAFFDTLKVHAIAPSSVTKAFWLEKASLPATTVEVAPHLTLSWVPRKEQKPYPNAPRVTVGFLGTPAPHKGWPLFEKLILSNLGSDTYRFVFFGTDKPPLSSVCHVPVHVTAEDPSAMINALSAEGVDLVLHWASWPETFSFSTYEALAGGAYVITNPASGNVAHTVRWLKRGVVLRDEAELLAFFKDDRALRLALNARTTRTRYDVRHSLSGMSHAFLQKDAAQ